MKTVKLALVALPLLLTARPADACSPPQCWPGAFVPSEGTTIPASAEALYWRPMSGSVEIDPASVRLVATSNPGTAIAVTTTELDNGDYLIEPTTPLVAGTQYHLEDPTECGGNGATAPEATFTTTAAAALPTALGTLSSTAPGRSTLQVGTSSGSCSTEVDAVSTLISLTFDASAEPWRYLLHYKTFVDDRLWVSSSSILASTGPGASWVGRGTDGIYRVCSTEDTSVSLGVAAGEHVVRMEATLPGTSVVLASSTVTINLECEPGDSDDGDGLDGGDDTGMPTDDDGVTPTDDDGGCAAGGGAGLLVALGAIGALTLRRRRH